MFKELITKLNVIEELLGNLRAYLYYEVSNTNPQRKEAYKNSLIKLLHKCGYMNNTDPLTW